MRPLALALAVGLLLGLAAHGEERPAADPPAASAAAGERPAEEPPARGLRFRGPDPILTLILALLVASLFGSPTRAGRLRGAVLGGGSAAFLTWFFNSLPPWIALAAVLGAAVGWFAPVQGSRGGAEPWRAERRGGSAAGRW